MADPRHFLDLDRIDRAVLRRILDASARMKAAGGYTDLLKGKTLAMVFEKPSTRTRVSFEVAIKQLGGSSVILDSSGSQLERGETVADTARVLSQYVDAIMLRTTTEANLYEMAEAASVPVINGLTDKSHPCQIMADVMTFEETNGPIEGRIVAWSGDGNNVACSWIHAAVQFGFELRVASPAGLQPPARLVRWAGEQGGRVSVCHDPEEAVAGADCVVTDTWVSMGDDGAERRRELLAPFQVNADIMARAKPDAIFMHCLPVYRGNEVTAEVVDGPQSVIWTEAGNRLHAQKGVLAWCISGEAALA